MKLRSFFFLIMMMSITCWFACSSGGADTNSEEIDGGGASAGTSGVGGVSAAGTAGMEVSVAGSGGASAGGVAGTDTLILSTPFIEISESYDPATKLLGDLDCTVGTCFFTDPPCQYCIVPFGAHHPGADNTNPNFDIHTVMDAAVFSASDGVVVDIESQPESDDYSIQISPRSGSVYRVEYDHITNLAVELGDTVIAGDRIGTVHNEHGRGRIELQINVTERGSQITRCPIEFATTEFSQAFERVLQAHNTAFSDYSYDELCAAETVIP